MASKEQDIEMIQRMVTKVIATHPAGRNLLLIGGFRYRLLNQSARFSRDVDYHWEGDLEEKQAELVRLCRRVLIPQVSRQLAYEGVARPASGAEADSPTARFLDLRFWKPQVADSALVMPVEVTRIVCLDPIAIRTVEGIVYPTPSDADLIEGKIIAIFNRVFIEHRDLVDLFLYSSHLLADSPRRLEQKFQRMEMDPASVQNRLSDLRQNSDYHARAIQSIIDKQMDPVIAAQINAAGGGRTAFARTMQVIESNLPLYEGP